MKRDMSALHDEIVEGGGETQDASPKGTMADTSKVQVMQDASQHITSHELQSAADLEKPKAESDICQNMNTDTVEPDTATTDLETLWKAMGINDGEDSIVAEVNSPVSVMDETVIPEKDLEERWKAMGFDDADLLDDVPPEGGNDGASLLQSQRHALVHGDEDVPQSVDITATDTTPYIPSQQPISMTTDVPIQAQFQSQPRSQPHPPPVTQRPVANPYVPERYQGTHQPLVPPPSHLLTNIHAPHQPPSSEFVQNLPVPASYSSQGMAKPPNASTSNAGGIDSAAYGPELSQLSKPPSVPSFVDKAKGGYQSPYDLPVEFTKPVKRVVSVPQPVQKAPSQQLQQQIYPPRSHPVSYKPTPAPPKSAPAPISALPPPPSTNRHSAKISPPPSACNSCFPSHISGDGKAGFSVDTIAAANAARPALVPSPPATPPMTGAPMARSAQSSARSKYSPHPLQPEQSQIQGQAAITPQQPGFVPTGRSPHARIPSRLEKDPSVNVATVRLAPPPFTATSRVPSPASIVPQVAAQHMPLSREDSVTRATFTELNYIVPDDGQESDPLQRWRGAPILKFGFGGLTCSTFPKLVPKYLTGHALPKMKPIPGEIQIRKAGDIVPSALLPTESAGFPGPLSSKSKKNDVIAWMTQIIAQIQERGGDDEEALLWKVVRLLLEHDGVLNGAPAVLDAVCTLIFPKELSDSHKTVVAAAEKAVSPDDQASALTRVRAHLMAGLRETAVWEAADSRLWGHALLLSSSLEDKSVWKRVSEEFVQRELNPMSHAQPLAALYEVLAGNPAECVDQLVPPSARAGLQMMDKAGSKSQTGILDGLDKWRETIVLILRNMSHEGSIALVEISRLLASFGRVAASHICALLARSFGAPVLFSGTDDPQSTIALLGWDHRCQPAPAGGNLSSILLTEVYEFATTVLSNQSATMSFSYLQAFKLIHAERIAELGDIPQALEYCDGFASTLKKTGHRPSPYYHAMLVMRWEDLHNRLTPLSQEGISAWISKPSMSKVSGSVWAKFQNFIAGEDVQDSPSSSPRRSEEIGILSSTSLHTISAQSVMSQQLSQQHQQPKYGLPLPSPSIYSPKSRHTPANSRDLSMASSTSAHQYTPTSYIPQTQTPSARTSLDSNAAATSTSRHFSMTLHGDQRSLSTASLQNASRADSRGRFIEASQLQEDAAGPSTNIESLVPTRSESIYRDTIESRKSTSPIVAADGETIASSSIHSQPDYMGYMPPTANSLSDSPALSTASVEEETLELKGKRRSYIMEDDEDDAELLRRAAALKESEEKRRSQVEQEKAKMTEKNAQQSSSQQKRGWFSGWFGGSTKKESTSPATVTRAKLGEENSFYYDKDLKRWVNRKDPGAATAATGTLPPPPKASGPLKREPRSGSTSPTPSLPASTGAPPVTAVGLGQTAVAASGKSTELKFSAKSAPTKSSDILPSSSNVASATDAASAPTMPRNIGDASSLDDLLNTPAPVPRVHTTRSKRKGRGYVDLMAK